MKLSPAYFETLFNHENIAYEWPTSFAIITAYATTGENWTDEQNKRSDERLIAVLQDRRALICRITGYSPETGHCEPGCAAAIDLEQAVALGRDFRQDAIYFVKDDTLYVTLCEKPELVVVGAFRKRLRQSSTTDAG